LLPLSLPHPSFTNTRAIRGFHAKHGLPAVEFKKFPDRPTHSATLWPKARGEDPAAKSSRARPRVIYGHSVHFDFMQAFWDEYAPGLGMPRPPPGRDGTFPLPSSSSLGSSSAGAATASLPSGSGDGTLGEGGGGGTGVSRMAQQQEEGKGEAGGRPLTSHMFGALREPLSFFLSRVVFRLSRGNSLVHEGMRTAHNKTGHAGLDEWIRNEKFVEESLRYIFRDYPYW
jgi:hypothetical protein